MMRDKKLQFEARSAYSRMTISQIKDVNTQKRLSYCCAD